MLLDTDQFAGRGEGDGYTCPSCKQPVLPGQRTTRVEFDSDPHGFNGLTGEYHMPCSKPFVSIAAALRVLGRSVG